MFKSNGGFTLVELIVVIAILAILAGVAVPAYSGYIASANEASDKAQVVTLNQSVVAACSFHGVQASTVTVTFADNKITVTGSDDAKDIASTFAELYAGNSLDLKAGTIKWSKGEFVYTAN